MCTYMYGIRYSIIIARAFFCISVSVLPLTLTLALAIISDMIFCSDWNSLSVFESELVHDIIDSEEEAFEDEDDSNGVYTLYNVRI